MDVSDSIDKLWDHPWTTEEMRKKRREWSLAGDVGLLKHLQQFSENLMSKANKTQAALDTLTTQLKETGILVDNVTNTSLALANTQFIESRVHEDDIEIKENSEKKQTNMKTQDLAPENLLASISENVKQGLNIMDEKYKMMDVACSDSEDDDGGAIVVSVMVGPNDLYQDRPLPYVIGSDKWVASNKIGLESSSSESEQLEEENESESEKEKETRMQKVFNNRRTAELNIARLSSSSSSDSYNYNDASSNIPYMNNSKVDAMSQNNVNSTSDSVTPNNMSQISNNTTPNFAEELAKRLGTVRQAQKPVTMDDANESSINRLKADLFTSEKNDDNIFNDNSDNPFNDKKGFFDDQVSSNLWREKPITSYKSNIIPPSIDMPPPISIVSTKPKSAIDDLFADADSEEDSDDIFSSRNTAMRKHMKESSASDSAYPASAENISKKFLDVLTPGIVDNIATNTPESRVNVSNLFDDDDDENDDGDLFGIRGQQSPKLLSASNRSVNMKQESSKKQSIGGMSIFGNTLPSDIENKLSSQIMRQQSSDSFDNDAPGNYDGTKSSETAFAKKGILNNNIMGDRNSMVTLENPVENISVITDNSNNSGISIQPPSTDNTARSGLWMNFQPEMSSTRPKSEEIYRSDFITNDSLFAIQTRNPTDFNSASVNANSNNQQPRQEQHKQGTSSALLQDYENDDLFGPPPLPSKTDSKRVKSKVSSLFDDSDSGDELFSAASSGSRSQKSTDLLATVSLSDKTKSTAQGGGLFNDDMDIFGSKDCPDVDIFGTASKSKSRNMISNDLFDNHDQGSVAPNNNRHDKSQTTRMESKKIILFHDDNENDDEDDDDLFGAKPKRKSSQKSDLFESENDLFLSTNTNDGEYSSTRKSDTIKSKTYDSMDVHILNTKKKSNNDPSESKLFSSTEKTHNLLFEDDDYEDLFGKKEIMYENNRLSESREEDKKYSVEKMQEFPKEDRSSAKLSILNVKETAESNINGERNKKDVEEISNTEEDVDGTARKRPPKTLNIRTTASPSEDGNQVPRKSVSGKIKNLMGKMGDLKILSPMDAPLLWRKSEEKDEDGDFIDRVSDNGCQAAGGRISPPSVSEDSTRKESSYSTISSSSNMEVAINFDDLAQVETLSTAASKSRVRIQAKRRPQSRHARKSALRHSGIDFDTIDNVDDSQEENQHIGVISHAFIKNSSSVLMVGADRLSANDNAQRTIDLITDDKSELGSISKESSLSVNRNTLLSPSTDEEDLFDVPPDLPEDPQKEDTLFGRAPILSPVNGKQSEKITVTAEPPTNTVARNVEIDINVGESKSNERQNSGETTQLDQIDTKPDISSNNWEWSDEQCTQINNEQDEIKRESGEEPNDPLRDSSHDPLKNPSQLFAFVTKTPSPDKGKGLLFSEDDSLFSSAKKSTEELPPRKNVLDLFADNADGDLFSAPLKKPVRKPLRDKNISLFDDDDNDGNDADTQNNEEDNLFGSTFSKTRIDAQKSISIVQTGRRKNNIFDDDDEDDSSLFLESSGHSQKSDSTSISEPKHDFTDSAKDSNTRDIFSETSCNDIFATRKVVPKKVVPSKPLFESDDDDDDGHIFGKSSTSMDSKTGTAITNSKPTVKKLFTRDLKKTAERIVEDPLSLLQDD